MTPSISGVAVVRFIEMDFSSTVSWDNRAEGAVSSNEMTNNDLKSKTFFMGVLLKISFLLGLIFMVICKTDN
jgi:hypothetical protein